ncbi:MAG TPA: hypothetical protein VF026_06185 [Ktedonobacteraceae bacterium]
MATTRRPTGDQNQAVPDGIGRERELRIGSNRLLVIEWLPLTRF